MPPSNRPLRIQLAGVYFLLLPASTVIAMIGMPGLVGLDWPGWTSAVLGGYLLTLLLGLVMLVAVQFFAVSGWWVYAVRWVLLVGVLAIVGRVVWSLYDAGERAVFLAAALIPALVVLAVAAVLLWFAWPQAVTREIAAVAAARGWQAHRQLPADLTLPSATLPLPVRRPWVVRNVVRADGATAFEVRWLEWRGRRRLAVFLGPVLEIGLPVLTVQPGGFSAIAVDLVADDIDLESEEFNRSFETRGADRRYVIDMLHPRAMQVLLDARPLGLVVQGDALVGYTEGGLRADALSTGLGAVTSLVAGIPRHVYERWGSRVPAARGLRFTGRPWSRSLPGAMLLGLGTAAGVLAITLAACLGAAAADANSRGIDLAPPNHSVSTLIAAAVTLVLVAVACTAADRLLARLRP